MNEMFSSTPGDGAPVGKFKTVVNISISLIDEDSSARRQPRLLGISTAKETYDNLKIILREVRNEISDLQENGLLIQGNLVRFTFYLAADYKLLLSVCGMKGANGNFACIYCDKKKSDYCNGGGKARLGFEPNQPGVNREWLLPMIPVDRIVVDVLHMYLRISDRLLLLIRREISDSKAQQFVDILCSKITCRGRITVSDGKVEFSNLDKSDRKKIVSFLAGSDCLVKFLGDRGAKLRDLLGHFERLMSTVTNSEDENVLRAETGAFRVHFLSLVQSQWVTPYLHILFHHCHEIVGRIGCCLNVFTQQQVEKLNHSVTSSFYNTTNFRNGEKQVLLQHGRRLLVFDR